MYIMYILHEYKETWLGTGKLNSLASPLHVTGENGRRFRYNIELN